MKRTRHTGGMSTSNMILAGVAALIVAIGAFAVFQSVQVQARQKEAFAGWYENFPGYAKATQEVGMEKKPMVLYFYAPWCPHCKKFTQDLLSTDEVREYLASKFIRVKVYPETSPQDQALMSAYKPYGANGYPSFFVIRGPSSVPVRVEPNLHDPKVEKLKTPKQFIADIEGVLNGKMPDQAPEEKPLPVVVPGQ